MKSRSIRIDSRLRQAAEAVLSEGESLSQFIETAVRQSIAYRRLRREFLARGIASRDQARRKVFRCPGGTRDFGWHIADQTQPSAFRLVQVNRAA